uniref:Uncharacterized protein n=1 Tax=viral metagenome TaxID=1070528 RepID=A0A6M3M440_9ZZZZ
MSDHQWALLDDVGIIEQGTEEEIRAIWDNPDEIYMKQEVAGDLRLIEIHEVMK